MSDEVSDAVQEKGMEGVMEKSSGRTPPNLVFPTDWSKGRVLRAVLTRAKHCGWELAKGFDLSGFLDFVVNHAQHIEIPFLKVLTGGDHISLKAALDCMFDEGSFLLQIQHVQGDFAKFNTLVGNFMYGLQDAATPRKRKVVPIRDERRFKTNRGSIDTLEGTPIGIRDSDVYGGRGKQCTLKPGMTKCRKQLKGKFCANDHIGSREFRKLVFERAPFAHGQTGHDMAVEIKGLVESKGGRFFQKEGGNWVQVVNDADILKLIQNNLRDAKKRIGGSIARSPDEEPIAVLSIGANTAVAVGDGARLGEDGQNPTGQEISNVTAASVDPIDSTAKEATDIVATATDQTAVLEARGDGEQVSTAAVAGGAANDTSLLWSTYELAVDDYIAPIPTRYAHL